MKKLIYLCIVALLVVSALPVRAATKFWDGSANGNWSVGGNWGGGTAPVAGDDLVFTASPGARRNTTNNFILSSAAFRSIRFTGTDYKIYGAVIALTSGITFDGGGGFSATGTNTINAPIELRASQSFAVFANPPGALLDINGDIALGPHTLTVNNGPLGATVHFSGVISGTGGINKFAGGTLRFDGIFANTYTGPTRINIGRLELNKGLFSGETAVPGELIVGNETVSTPSTVQLLRDNQIPDTSEVTIYDNGLLDLNGSDETIASLTLNGGTVDSGAGQLTLDGHVTATSTTNSVAVIDGELSLGLTTRTFTVHDGPFFPDLRIDAIVRGFGGLTKAGAGTLELNAANSFTGLTVVQAGLLGVIDDGALGSTANGTVVSNGATVSVYYNTHIGEETLTLNGSEESAFFGALSGGNGSNSWSGPITLARDSTIRTADSAFLNLPNVISGSGGFTKMGEGTLIFSGGLSNTYTGPTRVHEGTLLLTRFSFDRSIQGDLFIGDGVGGASSDVVRIEGAAQINNSSAVTIAASGFFDQNTPSEVIGSLEGFGRVDLAGNQLIVGGTHASTSYGGQILGTFNFVKAGVGRMTLTGDNPFSGTLIATLGTLTVNGSQPRSDVTVQAAGGVGGGGTVGHIGAYGTVAPGSGASVGILSCSNLTFLPGSHYFVALNGPNPGTGYDQLNVRGDVVLGTAALHVSVLQPPPVSGSMTIIANDGSDPVTGVFTGLPNGAQFAEEGLLFQISYAGGDGNDVVLTRISAPASTLTEFNALPDGNKRLRGLGLPNLDYTLEATTNLNVPIPWLVIGEARANGAGVYEWIDSDAPSHPMRFYRAQSP
jgi:fibronectin-binding autotransporter adhesin